MLAYKVKTKLPTCSIQKHRVNVPKKKSGQSKTETHEDKHTIWSLGWDPVGPSDIG